MVPARTTKRSRSTVGPTVERERNGGCLSAQREDYERV